MENQKLKYTFYCMSKFARSTEKLRIQDTSQLFLTHHPRLQIAPSSEASIWPKKLQKYHLKFKENLILNKKYLIVVNIC